MKRFILILIIVFTFIGFNEVKSFNNSIDAINVVNGVSQACAIDMQKDNSIICD